ncbi:MAG: GYD domain-containing protein [Dehalococcoidia bacterium]|jgi:uncharacterized protein with GYD domain|nr:GYD domain-containing protein [Dehalococcoidia bacterium]
MSKFMYSGNYTKRGIKGLLKDGGTVRKEETIRLVESLGGKIEAYYWCYGRTDFVMIMDFPDHTTVTGMALNISASGTFTGNLTPLISVEEMDEMVKVSIKSWKAPGK